MIEKLETATFNSRMLYGGFLNCSSKNDALILNIHNDAFITVFPPPSSKSHEL